MITGAQIRAARAMVRWSQDQLASSSKLPIEVIRVAESADGAPPITAAEEKALRAAFQGAGIEFTNAGGPGVKLKVQAPLDEGLRPQELTAENDG